jgi:signal transduction histidine kinase
MENAWPKIVEGQTLHNESIFSYPENRIWTKDTFFSVKDANGQATKVMLIAQDISPIKEQQLEIQELNEELSANIEKIAQQNEALQQQRLEIEVVNKALENQKDEVLKINQHLEERVEARTKDLAERNIQLAEYAYINSHLLRGPLCSILGLVQLLEIDGKSQRDGQLIMHLKKSSGELSEVVEKISKAIEEKVDFSRDTFSQVN